MAITTMDQLVAALANAQIVQTYDASLTAKAAGTFSSLWEAGGFPGSGSTPATGAGAAPTNSTAGALPLTNPSGSNTLYLARLGVTGATIGSVTLYDRLVHTSGLVANIITSQTVSSTALTRQTTGAGVMCWAEIYTPTGATPENCTITYTNSASVGSRSGTIAFPASPVAGQMLPMTLAAGDEGVQSVQSVQFGTTTGTAGNWGITLGYDFALAPIQIANVAAPPLDYAALGLPVIETNACLALRVLCSTTSTGIILAQFALAQG